MRNSANVILLIHYLHSAEYSQKMATKQIKREMVGNAWSDRELGPVKYTWLKSYVGVMWCKERMDQNYPDHTAIPATGGLP